MPAINERQVVPGKRLGRHPVDHAAVGRSLKLTDYLDVGAALAMTRVPGTVDHIGPVRQWNLGANNRFGTCGPTSCSNFTNMTLKLLAGLDVTVADEDVFTLYRQSGNPNFDPATGADDNGVDMNVLMAAWMAHGLSVTLANGTKQLVKPVATATVSPQDIDGVRAATALLGGVLFGANMTVAQQSQQIWSPVPGSAEWGGHAFFGGAYTSVAADDEHIISWAEKFGTTDSFISQQVEEVHVAILPQALKNPRFVSCVNLAAFERDWTDLTHQPFPKIV